MIIQGLLSPIEKRVYRGTCKYSSVQCRDTVIRLVKVIVECDGGGACAEVEEKMDRSVEYPQKKLSVCCGVSESRITNRLRVLYCQCSEGLTKVPRRLD